MEHFKSLILLFLFLFAGHFLFAQDGGGGTISGNLETNANFFIKDAEIGAANTPQYERQLFGADSWMNLNYSNWGFDFGLRFDMFNNSFLKDPQQSYTEEGIGRWYIKKKIQKLGISVGHLYDQIGSGIIFRAYEERPLFIDNALFGVRLTYDIAPDWQLKGFTGRQKNEFGSYQSIIKGASVEGFVSGKEGSGWSIAPGFGVVGRTHSDDAGDQLRSAIATYTPADTVSVRHNGYAFTLYNTLTAGKFNWYVEGAYKTEEVFFDQFAIRQNWDGTTSEGKFISEPGTVIYSSLSYANKGLGVTLEGKRTENFTFRADPFVVLNRGMINFLPPMTRIASYRLISRYQAATQELGEQALQMDVKYALNKQLSFGVNFSNITDLENELLYREIFTQIKYKYKRKWMLQAGVQLQRYNQAVYELKPETPIVETLTPYFDFLYKFDRKKAIRFEGQYMFVGDDLKSGYKQDYGDWLFGLAEFTIAPHWTFTISDMYNVDPGKKSPEDDKGMKKSIHYPRFDIYYTHRSNRFSLSYVKQVEGIVCSGGICRLEPAFSGVKMTVNSSF